MSDTDIRAQLEEERRIIDAALLAAALTVRNAQIDAVLELHVLADYGECNECSNGTPYPCPTVLAIKEAA